MVRTTEGGAAIAVEVWDMPSNEFGSFLYVIPAPLALGKVKLANGRWETGFICEAYGLETRRSPSCRSAVGVRSLRLPNVLTSSTPQSATSIWMATKSGKHSG